MTKITLPELGEGIEEATICHWYASTGHRIERDEDLVEISTDKATFNVPSPERGTVKKILFKEGDTVKVGSIIAEISED